MPYNYLIDEKIRKTMNIDWAKTIIIFDEAHNIAQATEDITSFDLKEKTLLDSETETDQLIAALKNTVLSAELENRWQSNMYGLTMIKEVTRHFYKYLTELDVENYESNKSIKIENKTGLPENSLILKGSQIFEIVSNGVTLSEHTEFNRKFDLKNDWQEFASYLEDALSDILRLRQY